MKIILFFLFIVASTFTHSQGQLRTGGLGGAVGLNNVTNESKTTMFTSPTFTGTVNGVTASMVGLGNVTNESKATMFTSPTFTGGAILGTPGSGTLINCTFPTLNQNTTGTANIAGGTAGAIPYQSGANATSVLAATATANKVLMSGASAAPVWSTPTYPNTATAGTHLVGDGTNWTAVNERNNWTSLVVSGSNYTNATTGLTDITGLVSATLSTATLYEFEAVLYVNSSSTAGVQLAAQQTGTGSGQIGVWSGTATNAAATGMAIGSNTLGTQGAACVLVNGDGTINIRGFIKTGSSGSPTIKLQMLKTTSGTATVLIGSVMRFRQAN